MGHRDDREAERARIAALEDEVEEARARAERAEREARTAREALAAGARRAEEAQAEAAEARRREGLALANGMRQASAQEPRASGTPGWRPEEQRRYVRVCLVATLCANAVILPAIVAFDDSAEAFNRAVVLGLGAAGVLAAVRGVAAKVTAAPGVWNAMVTTLVDTPLALGAMAMAGSGSAFAEVLSGTAFDVARIASAIAMWIVGSVMGSYWSAESASSASTGD